MQTLAAADPLAESLAARIADLPGDLPREVERELRTGHRMEAVLAEVRQRRVAEAHSGVDARLLDGIGQLTLRVDGAAYHYWGQRLGYACWRDNGFRREFARDNPETRVRSRSAKIGIVRP